MLNSVYDLASWALASSLLLLLLLLLRRTSLTAKLSRTLLYALWLPVLLRLLLPMQLLPLPIYPHLPENELLSESIATPNTGALSDAPLVSTPSEASKPTGAATSPVVVPSDVLASTAPTEQETPPQSVDARGLSELVLLIWQGGAAVLAVTITATNLSFTAKLRRRRAPLADISASLPVYTVEQLGSPCLAGLLRPAIYLSPEDAQNPQHLRHIVAHEETHRQHGDHVWSLLRAVALCLHWYNPLVWYAAALSKRDAELACDECTLRRLGGGERTAYGETLLSLTMAQPNARDLLSCSTAMVGDKKTLRARIEGIAHSRQTRAAAAFFVLAVLALALIFAFGKQSETTDEYAEFLQRVEAAERIAYHPPVYSSTYYPALTDIAIVAEAKESLLRVEPASESDVPEGELNIMVASGFSLDGEYRYYLLNVDGVTLLYQQRSDADGLKDSDFTLIGKYTDFPIASRLSELSGAQKGQDADAVTGEGSAALYYAVMTEDGYSKGVDEITTVILKNDSLRVRWSREDKTLASFLTIQNGGHQLYYGISSDDLSRDVVTDPHWFLKTINGSDYAIFDVPADLLDELTAIFRQYDTNALRFLTRTQASDISSAVLTAGKTESALDEGLRDDLIFDSLRAIAKEELFREVTGEDTLNKYPSYDFSVTLELTNGARVTLWPMSKEKGSVFMSLVSETENRRFVLENADTIYRALLQAAGVGDAQDEQRGKFYVEASVSGSETDLEAVARSIGEQIAASWLAVSDETVWKPTDAYLDGETVFDIYYGENGVGRNFCAGMSWKLKFDSRFSANYWEAGAGLFGPDENGYYSFGLDCLFRIDDDGRWHIAEYGSGGYSVDCGIDLYHEESFDCASLVKVFFLTDGQTHDYLIPSRFCDLPARERAKLGTALDGYTEEQASNFLHAVADHLAQYPTYHELTAEMLYAELPDKYKAFAPILAAEPFWTGDAGGGRFALYDYGKTEWALVYEIGDVREILATYYNFERPDATISAQTMDDLLSFPGVVVRSDLILGVHRNFGFFAVTDYGVQYVANAFGFLYDDFSECGTSLDLDGDGRNELVTSNTFGGDGTHRVYVYRWSGSFAEQGYPDWSKAGVDLSRIGEMHYQESCDTSRGTVTIAYTDEDGESKTAELPLAMESFEWTKVRELF